MYEIQIKNAGPCCATQYSVNILSLGFFAQPNEAQQVSYISFSVEAKDEH